ncbi:MAG: right-handed parallel beta-helix repeat-containing protein, partial [Proteobacteria bacterium]|nr:right-handed parallel beta-helix repeat-containing protein [Pseudomonadota bacterium]
NSSVQNFTFKHFILAGVEVNTSDNIVVQNCHFEYNYRGLSGWTSTNLLVTNNTFDNNLNASITVNANKDFDVKNSIIEKNRILNSGMFPLYCRRYEGVCYGIGISVFGKAFTVRRNYLENIGWNGIDLKDGGHHIIENNIVHKALSLINDGGAINISSSGNIIRGNFLLNTIGNVDESNGCGSTVKTPCMHHHSYGMGIASDSGSKDTVIENNTIANNSDMGIHLNSFTNATVRNNIVYNNDLQIAVKDKNGPSNNNVVEGNIMYSLHPEQVGLYLTNTTNHGSFDNNVYCNPYNDIIASRDGKQYSLTHWQKEFPTYDKASSQCNINFSEYTVTNVGTNLINNSNFDTDTSNWKGPVVHDNSSLKIEFKQGSNNANAIPNDVSLIENQWYRLKFTILGNDFGRLRLIFNDVIPGESWNALKMRYFIYDQNIKQYEMFFQSPVTTEYGKILFSTKEDDANYWLDDVSFEPVDMVLNDAKKRSVLFMNPTENTQDIDLKGITYQDLSGKIVTGNINLEAFSSQILIVTEEVTLSKPIAPKFSITKTGKTVTATWDSVAEATDYILYYAPYSPYTGPDSIGDFNIGSQTSYSIELSSGAAFYVAVVANNKAGRSGYSNIESFIIE